MLWRQNVLGRVECNSSKCVILIQFDLLEYLHSIKSLDVLINLQCILYMGNRWALDRTRQSSDQVDNAECGQTSYTMPCELDVGNFQASHHLEGIIVINSCNK